VCNQAIEVRADHGTHGIGERRALIERYRPVIPVRQVDRESDVRRAFGVSTGLLQFPDDLVTPPPRVDELQLDLSESLTVSLPADNVHQIVIELDYGLVTLIA
jgi:hypothetical protein